MKNFLSVTQLKSDTAICSLFDNKPTITCSRPFVLDPQFVCNMPIDQIMATTPKNRRRVSYN